MSLFRTVSFSLPILLATAGVVAQDISNTFEYWQEVAQVDREFSRAATEQGRTEAYLDVLGEGSVLFRDGPVDARALYQRNQTLYSLDQLYWRDHFIDVSRAGDLGIVVGPNVFTPSQLGPNGEVGQQSSGYLVNAWHKTNDQWTLMADMVVTLPGFLSMDVEADFQDTVAVMAETAHEGMAANNTMESLAEADNTLGLSINFRGGQRAIGRFGLNNVRVYLPAMGPAVGMEAAGAAYGRYLDSRVTTSNPIEVNHMGGYLAQSKELGYTYGTMSVANQGSGSGFRVNYLRVWRFSAVGEWKVAMEFLSY
ncbi:MAG: hypothetical protein KJN90_00480 [Gammaproteobacteria bacterium]|nr:hypothetical protein [Gammaproteobacteria bacterium]